MEALAVSAGAPHCLSAPVGIGPRLSASDTESARAWQPSKSCACLTSAVTASATRDAPADALQGDHTEKRPRCALLLAARATAKWRQPAKGCTYPGIVFSFAPPKQNSQAATKPVWAALHSGDASQLASKSSAQGCFRTLHNTARGHKSRSYVLLPRMRENCGCTASNGNTSTRRRQLVIGKLVTAGIWF